MDVRLEKADILSEVNSDDTESFHNWSSNSHWFVFSSRRDNGLYTYLYIAGVDADGKVTKPFMLPQKRPFEYYDGLVYSFNVPDFVRQPVEVDHVEVREKLVKPERVKLTVRERK